MEFVKTFYFTSKVDLINKCFSRGIPVLLHGETGTGKTATAEFCLDNKNLQTIYLSSETTVEQFIGSTHIGEKPLYKKTYIQGPFSNAFSKGFPLIIENINFAKECIHQLIKQAIDTKKLTILYNDEVEELTMHPSFKLIVIHKGEMNEMFNDFYSRFAKIKFDKILKNEIQEIAKNYASRNKIKETEMTKLFRANEADLLSEESERLATMKNIVLYNATIRNCNFAIEQGKERPMTKRINELLKKIQKLTESNIPVLTESINIGKSAVNDYILFTCNEGTSVADITGESKPFKDCYGELVYIKNAPNIFEQAMKENKCLIISQIEKASIEVQSIICEMIDLYLNSGKNNFKLIAVTAPSAIKSLQTFVVDRFVPILLGKIKENEKSELRNSLICELGIGKTAAEKMIIQFESYDKTCDIADFLIKFRKLSNDSSYCLSYVNYFLNKNKIMVINHDFMERINPYLNPVIETKKLHIKEYKELKEAIVNIEIFNIINRHCIIRGETGIGKKSLAIAAAKTQSKDVYSIAFNKSTKLSDLFGEFSILKGEVIFKESDFIKALRKGGTFIATHLEYCEKRIIQALMSFLKAKPGEKVIIPNHEYISVNQDFLFIGCFNTDTPASLDLNCIKGENITIIDYPALSNEKRIMMIKDIIDEYEIPSETKLQFHGFTQALKEPLKYNDVRKVIDRFIYFNCTTQKIPLYVHLAMLLKDNDRYTTEVNDLIIKSFNLTSSSANDLDAIINGNVNAEYIDAFTMKVSKGSISFIVERSKFKFPNNIPSFWNAVFRICCTAPNEKVSLIGSSVFKTLVAQVAIHDSIPIDICGIDDKSFLFSGKKIITDSMDSKDSLIQTICGYKHLLGKRLKKKLKLIENDFCICDATNQALSEIDEYLKGQKVDIHEAVKKLININEYYEVSLPGLFNQISKASSVPILANVDKSSIDIQQMIDSKAHIVTTSENKIPYMQNTTYINVPMISKEEFIEIVSSGIIQSNWIDFIMKTHDSFDFYSFRHGDILEALKILDLADERKILIKDQEVIVKNGKIMKSTISGTTFNIFDDTRLPDFNLYFTDSFQLLADKIFQCAIKCIPLIIEGPKGCGKTTAVKYIRSCFQMSNESTICVQIKRETTLEDLFGCQKVSTSNVNKLLDATTNYYSEKITQEIVIFNNIDNASPILAAQLSPLFNADESHMFFFNGSKYKKKKIIIIGLASKPLETQHLITNTVYYHKSRYSDEEIKSISELIKVVKEPPKKAKNQLNFPALEKNKECYDFLTKGEKQLFEELAKQSNVYYPLVVGSKDVAGKTSTIQLFAKIKKIELITVQMHQSMGIKELQKYIDIAREKRSWILIDDANKAPKQLIEYIVEFIKSYEQICTGFRIIVTYSTGNEPFDSLSSICTVNMDSLISNSEDSSLIAYRNLSDGIRIEKKSISSIIGGILNGEKYPRLLGSELINFCKLLSTCSEDELRTALNVTMPSYDPNVIVSLYKSQLTPHQLLLISLNEIESKRNYSYLLQQFMETSFESLIPLLQRFKDKIKAVQKSLKNFSKVDDSEMDFILILLTNLKQMIEDVSSNTGDLKVSFSKYERNDSRELAKDKFMLDFLNDICKDQSIPKNFKKSALYIGSQSSCISLFDHDEAVLPRMKLFLLLSELWRNQMRSYETRTIFTAFVNCFEKQNIKGIREIDQLNKAYAKAHKEGFKSFEEIIKSDKKKLFVNIKLSMGTNDITKFISQCRK